MRKYFLALPLSVLLASCALLQPRDPQDTLVVTEISQVVDIAQTYPLPIEKIPEKFRETYKDKVVVLAKQDNLKPDAKYVPLTTDEEAWDDTTVHTAISGLLAGLSGFFPWLAGLEGLMALLIPRKRQHYASAAKNLATLDLKDSLADLARGLGLAHSSDHTKEVFEREVKKKKVRKKKVKVEPKPEVLTD